LAERKGKINLYLPIIGKLGRTSLAISGIVCYNSVFVRVFPDPGKN
jgi:hypothetical protein